MIVEGKKNLKAIASDIAEGYITVNPLFLKHFNEESLKALYSSVMRAQTGIRIEPFPYHEVALIRKRNLKLQRLYGALIVIKNVARDRRYKFY
ncbi:MAG: hypothetical protein HQL09_04505 [Nitrospirae bacterium]|nr:hypothetical protein [Nitrospirota bacterium]